MGAQHCPICSAEVAPSTRYPRHVCGACAVRASSVDGRVLGFSNEGLLGEFVAEFMDTGEVYDGHECFIDGVKCHAFEARFGGIVIEVERA